MKKFYTFLFCTFVFNISSYAQVLLDADGPGNTYELITSVLAPGQNPIETPDCSHPSHGRHIEEVWDSALGDYVFAFHIHTDEDDDRCINFDRQRNEIKTYDKSPANLLGVIGETFVYKWKFKLDAGFQPSNSFTHLHQIKAVDGSESSMPQITLTARASNPDRLELRYAQDFTQVTLTTADLNLFRGQWVEATEIITYGDGLSGYYNISIVNVSTGSTILSYVDPAIRMWKTGASFQRPKWGIYRSLNNDHQLRDEIVYFADFSIEEFDCPPNYLASSYGAIIGRDGSTRHYETDGAIESTQVVLNGANIDYDSNIYIDLNPGFEVELNADFHAYMDGCN